METSPDDPREELFLCVGNVAYQSLIQDRADGRNYVTVLAMIARNLALHSNNVHSNIMYRQHSELGLFTALLLVTSSKSRPSTFRSCSYTNGLKGRCVRGLDDKEVYLGLHVIYPKD